MDDLYKKWSINGLVICLVLFVLLAALYPFVRDVDLVLSRLLYNFGGNYTDLFFIAITNLGSAMVSIPLLTVLVIILLMKRNYWLCIVLFINLMGVRFLNWLLKTLFGHDRPTLEHLVEAGFYSFPSGHSMNTLGFFGFLGYLYWYHVARKKEKFDILLYIFPLFILLVGISRIYLGVHFVLDVIGGFLAGAVWLIISIRVYHFKRL